MFRKSLLLVWLVLAQLALAPFCLAWGEEGHQIVAEIAQDRLATNAKREVRKLLGSESMVEVSTWADEYRGTHLKTGPWHYVNIQISEDGKPGRLSAATQGSEENVVAKITEFEVVLADKDASKEDRAQALKFLIHFVGDVHCPAHCVQRRYGNLENDKGGNEERVKYPGAKGTEKLHKVWDTTIITQELLGNSTPTEYADGLAKKLDGMADEVGEWRKAQTPGDWATESNGVAAEYMYRGVPMTPPEDGKAIRLKGDYGQVGAPVVERQLMKAGVRLADILNGLFPG